MGADPSLYPGANVALITLLTYAASTCTVVQQYEETEDSSVYEAAWQTKDWAGSCNSALKHKDGDINGSLYPVTVESN